VRALTIITNLFPLWVVLAGVIALIHPPALTWFQPYIIWGLAVIMLGMGITLSVDDFKATLKMPRAIAVGFLAQYTIMPFMGWAIANSLNLEPQVAVGLILVACCPGGTASNVVTYLAKGNVALSVLMTTASTFGAVIMTPLLTKWLAGKIVPVSAWSLFLDTTKVVLLPVIAGLVLHELFPRLLRFVLPVAPLASVITIALICGSIIGAGAVTIKTSGGTLLFAVFLLHAGGFALGYLFAKLFRYDKIIARTISIEVGMQNSGLGAFLARNNFSNLAAVPCAISSVFHSVIGSFLAAIWSRRVDRSLTPPESSANLPQQEVQRR
jgi:bile acid:Na+ symporter, BASS family